MKHLYGSLLFMAPLLVCACKREVGGGSNASPAAPASSHAATSVVASAISADSAVAKSPWADHAHDATHGGRVRTAGDGHLELKLSPTGHVTVWLLDGNRHPLSAKGASGTARVGSQPETSLSYDATEDVLHADVGGTAPGTTSVIEVRVRRADSAVMQTKFNVSPMP